MSILRVELRSDSQALIELEADWRRLWSLQPRREVFTSFSWSLSAWQAVPGAQDLCVVVVRRGPIVVGLLPLAVRQSTARFLSGANADYNDILVGDPDPAGVIAAAVSAVLVAYPSCVLDNLPEWSSLCGSFDQLPSALRNRICVEAGSPCPALRLATDREALLSSMMGKKSLKRHEKKLAQHGKVRLRHIELREQIRARLDDFFAQHVARRALAGGRSLFLDAASRSFYLRLIENFDPSGALRFSVLEVDDRAVAFHMGFELNGRFTWYKPSFDVDFWDCGVGEVLLKHLFEYIRDRPVMEFDFTRGDEAFKDRFSNHQGANVRWTVYRHAWGGAMARLRARAKRALKYSAVVTALRRRVESLGDQFRIRRGAWLGERVGATVLDTGLRLPQLIWASEELVALCVTKDQLASWRRSSSQAAEIEVSPASLRTIAYLAASPQAPFGLDELRRVHEQHRPGDSLFVGRQGTTTAIAAWIGARTELSPGWPGAEAAKVAMPSPVSQVQFIGYVLPRCDNGALAYMLDSLSRRAADDTIWLLCPALASGHLSELRNAGFEAKYRLGRSMLLGKPWKSWCHTY